jgi:Spy/CpxP family protein refolding chaperone
MQRKRLTLLAACLVLGFGLANAQQPPRPNPSRPSPDEAVKAILDLSDSQLQQLKDLRESMTERQREIATRMRELQQRRRELLQASPPNAAALTDLLIQEQNLQKQIQDQNKAFRDEALNLLTASQKEKVQKIEEAVKLARDAAPLARFGLLEGPGGGGFFIRGPGPGGPGSPGGIRFQSGGSGEFFEVPVPPPAFAPGPPPGQ